MTAIDREDIHALITALGHVVDFIEALASPVVRYGVQEYTRFTRLFAGVIQQMSLEFDLLVPALDRPKDMTIRLLTLHELEREGDEIYREATVDRCEYVGDLVERILIKNT
jgi:uncharacterized protein Yka (UPF0111/DUF47 family)